MHSAIDDLIERFDSLLDRTDSAVDNWLPETAEPPPEFHLDGAAPPATPPVVTSPAPAGGQPASASPVRQKRALAPLAGKLSRRLRQRIPAVRDLPHQTKEALLASSWFKRVDAILAQNQVVQLMQEQVSAAVESAHTKLRPAEHFYNTAVQVFQTRCERSAAGIMHPSVVLTLCVSRSYRTCEEFLQTLRGRMGLAWDERLVPLAASFFNSVRHLAQAPAGTTAPESS
jgi:hypothetical protein